MLGTAGQQFFCLGQGWPGSKRHALIARADFERAREKLSAGNEAAGRIDQL